MLRMMRGPASSGCKLYSVLDTINGADMCGEIKEAGEENMYKKYTEKNAAGKEKTITPTPHDHRTWQEGHKRRNANLFSLLLAHLVSDNLVRMLTQSANGDGYNAWKLLKAYCYRVPNDLGMSLPAKRWQDTNFDSVGIDRNTISNMILHLHAINSEFPDEYKKTADEIARKMLECFQLPRQGMATLGTLAMLELKKPEKFLVNGVRSAEAMRDAW